MGDEPVAALPRICYPSVWMWAGHALYAGPSLELAPHSGSVWCLAVGVDRPITVRVEDRTLMARSALIPPRLTHQLRCHGSRMIFGYFDPASDRAESCRANMTQWRGEIGSGHTGEDQLIARGASLFADDTDAAAQCWLDLAAPTTARILDARIADAIRRIREHPADAISARALATATDLSESRFLHLFRQEAGTSLRRYRTWARLQHAAALVAAGNNLTTAAAESGFASPSHLSDRFRTTFGLSATQLLTTGPRLHLLP
ncbi:helix-turn-helix transcriptional regulator [Nocardia sp. NPDC052566]|uniref:helix-turn-helix transcriptional regulator n=1 Tax=Nocardia sp. NPDC052566 TaxID=3364330 RepID=UPI0037C8F332